MVYRIYVEKKPGFDGEAQGLLHELVDLVGIQNLTGLRLLNRYDVEGIDAVLFQQAVPTVFSEPPVDVTYDKLPDAKTVFAVEYLPGQFDPERPILTKAHDVPPSRYATGSHACNSIISAGCIIKGTVRNSILSRGVVVEEGASVTNSIINQSCVIKSGARVENAILDKNNVVPTNTELRGTPENILVLGKAPLTSDITNAS